MSTFWQGKRVFMTGHTGFKGAWMCLVLERLGATVTGYALEPEDEGLFTACGVEKRIAKHITGDIRDLEPMKAAVIDCQPDVIIHMAAQALVLDSYDDPVGTFDTNVMGTLKVLEAARALTKPCAVVSVTTDKVYENPEQIYPFQERDRLGAGDPYSTSKAGAELVTACWRKNFFPGTGIRVAAVRAGNVIGGGDWAKNRLVPDCMRSFAAGEPVPIRNPNAVRPWQHVLDPLNGYLTVAEYLMSPGYSDAIDPSWNFGPDAGEDASVATMAQRAAQIWGDGASIEMADVKNAPHEAGLLRLDSTKARLELRWSPIWGSDDAVAETVRWYKAFNNGEDMLAFSFAQIEAHMQAAGWAVAA